MAYVISSNPNDVQFEVVHGWLKTAYWSAGIRADVLRKAIASSLVYSALDGEKQIGFARVVTDGATFAWVCDVYVDEAFRGQGIATALTKAILADERIQTVRRVCLGTKSAHAVYEPLGFRIAPPDRFMEILPPRERWADP